MQPPPKERSSIARLKLIQAKVVATGLVHLGVVCLVCILGRAGRSNVGGIHDGAGIDLTRTTLCKLPKSTRWIEERIFRGPPLREHPAAEHRRHLVVVLIEPSK